MPRIQVSEEIAKTGITGTVQKYKTNRNINTDKLAKAIGSSRQTLNRKLRNPDSLTLGEIKRIYKYLQVPEEERIKL